MDLLKEIMSAQGGAAAQELGAQLGLGEQQTAAALAVLIPALAAGVQQNAQNEGGFGNLISALSGGTHQQYLNNPETLRDPAAVAEGNGILGHVLGDKAVSREVASRAAAQTGISSEVMKRMLPLAATLLMGALARRSGNPAGTGLNGGAIGSMLGPLLDSNRDGSIVDDVTGMIGRFLKKR